MAGKLSNTNTRKYFSILLFVFNIETKCLNLFSIFSCSVQYYIFFCMKDSDTSFSQPWNGPLQSSMEQSMTTANYQVEIDQYKSPINSRRLQPY